MAVTKRTRFEVLRRDGYTCRYCHATDTPLTIDHVIPVALGGSDDPDNLVAACRDCNYGKSSSSADSELVAEVSEDAIRWARAMAEVARRTQDQRTAAQVALTHFKEHVWNAWTVAGAPCKLPPDWESAIQRQLTSGLDMADLDYAVKETMAKTWVTDEFRYFMGVCKTMLAQRMETARALIDSGEV